MTKFTRLKQSTTTTTIPTYQTAASISYAAVAPNSLQLQHNSSVLPSASAISSKTGQDYQPIICTDATDFGMFNNVSVDVMVSEIL